MLMKVLGASSFMVNKMRGKKLFLSIVYDAKELIYH